MLGAIGFWLVILSEQPDYSRAVSTTGVTASFLLESSPTIHWKQLRCVARSDESSC
jgi:hypothetical protein